MKATLIKKIERFPGRASLYRLEPPLEDGEDRHGLVIASAANCPITGRPETYLFPANEDGEVTDWCELGGSQKGTLSHGDVFADIGYEIEL